MQIVALKLVTGEEIIGGIVSQDHEKYILSKVRSLIMQQSPTGEIGLGMLPFMPSANNISDATESDVVVYERFVMAHPIGVAKALEDSYIKETSEIILN